METLLERDTMAAAAAVRELRDATTAVWYRIPRTNELPGLSTLTSSDSYAAVSRLFELSRKGSNYLTRHLCLKALEEKARSRDLQADSLIDDYFPDFGFQGGVRFVGYGRRTLRLRLGEDNRLTILHEGRVLRTMPQPLVGDDRSRISAIRREVALLKREVARAEKLLRMRFAEAQRRGDAWAFDRWVSLVGNPVVRNVARHLLWSAFTPDTFRIFRLAADGSVVDVDDEPVALEGEEIRVAAPMMLTDEDRGEWGPVLGDYRIQTDQLEPHIWEGDSLYSHCPRGQRGDFEDELVSAGWELVEGRGHTDDWHPWALLRSEVGPTAVLFAWEFGDRVEATHVAFGPDAADDPLPLAEIPPPTLVRVTYNLRAIGDRLDLLARLDPG